MQPWWPQETAFKNERIFKWLSAILLNNIVFKTENNITKCLLNKKATYWFLWDHISLKTGEMAADNSYIQIFYNSIIQYFKI